ncbi:uncharacterized protein LOC130641982 [Hydractinia symbiolongicarpus]|uniref:uncharacterized protein LOC130641982 n=1 Tax=Hydractinia symbiolongicarpus TaxID=13093 RepID=UPI00254A6506|nr:uncharacterized protein LOC130641982 [Hydractinia symbiolongicarpus]
MYMIKIRTIEDGQQLYVKDMHKEHNHAVNKACFEHLPQQRRITDVDTSAEITKMLQLKASKKLLQNHVSKVAGKNVLLKNLHNIQAKMAGRSKNDVESLIREMRSVPGATVKVIVDSEDTLNAICYQDMEMRKAFSAYPDLLMLDATYKLNDLRMPVYLLICVDADGESEIVGVWIVMNKEKSTIVRMSECFKKHNPNHNQIEVVVIDKDMMERDTLKEQFPRASIQLCLFHTLRAFKREITTIKMGSHKIR